MPENKTAAWMNKAERMDFAVDQSSPIEIINHHFTKRMKSQYDMHYGLELGILLSGKMQRLFQEHKLNLKPGQVWFCGMWEPHGWKVNKHPCDALVLIISPELLARTQFHNIQSTKWLAPFYLKPKNRPQVPPDKLQQIKDIGYSLNQTLTRQKHLGFTWLHLKLLEILLILFEEIPEDKSLNLENSDSIDRVCKAVRLVFNNNKYISTKEAARKCGINRNLFAKLFKQIMGLSFKEFGLRYRVSGAAEELLQTDKPVKTVAFEWGFTDTSHLYRYFIKYYNCNPTSYRLHKKR